MKKYINIPLDLTGEHFRGNFTMFFHRIKHLSECSLGCIQNDSTFARELNVSVRTIQRWIRLGIDNNIICTNGKRNGNRVLMPSLSNFTNPVAINADTEGKEINDMKDSITDRMIASFNKMSDEDKEKLVHMMEGNVPRIESQNSSVTRCEKEEDVPQYVELTKSTQPKVTKIKKVKQPCTPPTMQEVADYCQRKGNTVDPTYFWNYYERYRIGDVWRNSYGEPVYDWKKTVVTWDRRNKANPHNQMKQFNNKQNVQTLNYSTEYRPKGDVSEYIGDL